MADENKKKLLFNYSMNIIIVILLIFISYMVYSIFVNTKNSNVKETNILTDTVKKQNINIDKNKISVEVLNGTGEKRIASEVRDFLIKNGFDVINYDNFDTNNVENTMIIDRVKDRKKAEKVAEALGLGNNRIQQAENQKLYTDVTVVIGKDYKDFNFIKKK